MSNLQKDEEMLFPWLSEEQVERGKEWRKLTAENKKLEPCPFCGGKAKYESDLNIIPLIDENGAYIDYDRIDYWERAYCIECGAEINSFSEDEEEITIKKWNRRAEIDTR